MLRGVSVHVHVFSYNTCAWTWGAEKGKATLHKRRTNHTKQLAWSSHFSKKAAIFPKKMAASGRIQTLDTHILDEALTNYMYISYWECSAGWAELYTKAKHLNLINSELKHYMHTCMYTPSYCTCVCFVVSWRRQWSISWMSVPPLNS